MSVKMDTNTKQIYIQLLEEGTDVWRPTQAEDMGNNIFKVLPTPDYDPTDEVWEFLPGAIVRCEMTVFRNGQHLVAVEKIG